MSCTKCDWYKTVWELFSTDFKTMNLDIECSKRFPTLTKALSHLWSYSFLLPWFKSSEMIDTCWASYKACNRIYMPIWFFWRWCTNCIEEDAQCDACCQDWYGKIKMIYKDSVPYIWSAQYTMQCPLSDTIQYNLPRWVEEAYFTYYRYYNPIVDNDSLVEVPEYLMPALNMLVAYHSWVVDAADKVAIWEDFMNYMKQQYEVFKLSKQVPTSINFKLFT